MKQWEAKLLGFFSAWWLPIQMLFDGPLRGVRMGLAFFGIVVGGLWALFVAVEPQEKPKLSYLFANGFLSGIASLLALPFVIMAVMFLFGLAGALLGR